MNYSEKNGELFISEDKYFKPELFFDCGQSFRFFEKDNNILRGVAFGSIIEIKKAAGGYTVTSFPPLHAETLTDFFDLKRDYEKIENSLSGDLIMSRAMEYGRGIRILNQDFFETLLTFIYSQRSNIPKIAKCVEKTAELYGNEIEYKGIKYYTFPIPEQMRDVSIFSLEPIKCGYRAEYIVDAVHKVSDGSLNYNELKKLPYEAVREKLMTVKGVGEKVADCVCLFSFGFFEAFPTDTWIKKAMDSLYSVSEADIKSASSNLFGELSGIAQQYLFYYLRYNGKK